MSGALPLLLLRVFIALTEETLPLPYNKRRIFEVAKVIVILRRI